MTSIEAVPVHRRGVRWIRPAATAGVLGLALVLSGCGGTSSAGATKYPTFTRVSDYDAITDWDPAVANSNEGTAFNNIYDTLTHYDVATQKVEPDLATSWSQTNHGKTWTFTLRSGVLFHTGHPLTAAAAIASIKRTIQIGKGSAYIWSSVKTMSALPGNKIRFVLKYPANIPLIASAQLGAYIYDTKAAATPAKLAAFFKSGHEAGTGPYKLVSYSPGQQNELVLDRYTKYWGGWTGAHYGRVVYQTVSDLNTAWQLLSSGQADWVQSLTPQLFAQAKADSSLQTTQTQSLANLLAFFNTANGPLTDVRLRKALQLAIDYNGVISTQKGAAQPASGLVPPGLEGATDGLGLHQDLSAATRLLESAGYGPSGKKLNLTMTYAQGDNAEQTLATLLTSKLKQLNVNLEARAMDFNAQAAVARGKADKRQDIFVMYWYPSYADPQTWFSDLFLYANPPAFNFSYLDDASVNAGIKAVQQLAVTNPQAAQTKYADLQRRIIDTDAAVAPVFVEKYQRAYRAGIKGYVDNPVYTHATYVYEMTPPS